MNGGIHSDGLQINEDILKELGGGGLYWTKFQNIKIIYSCQQNVKKYSTNY
jgi:hypothetical protein